MAGAGQQGGEGLGAADLTRELLSRLPPPYDILAVSIAYPVQYYNSMNTVLKQVVARVYNFLVQKFVSI